MPMMSTRITPRGLTKVMRESDSWSADDQLSEQIIQLLDARGFEIRRRMPKNVRSH